MDPKVLDFLLINGFVVLLLVLYMAFWRPKRQPSRLKFLKSTAPPMATVHADIPKRERQLNVIFQFNGHDFEAYEVLGIAAGSAREAAEAAYQKALRESDADSHEFFKHAIEAIRQS